MIVFPEILLLDRIGYLLELLREDYSFQLNNGTESYSQLYRMFHDSRGVITHDSVNYYEEAKAVFITSRDDRRNIILRKGWDINKPIEKPVIAILMSSETASGYGLGFDRNTESISIGALEDFSSTSRRAFRSNYSVWFASVNQNITNIMFKVVRSMLIGSVFMLEDKLQNVSFGASDLSLRPEMAPSSIAVKSLTINFTYEDEGTDFNHFAYIKDIKFNPKVFDGS